MTVQIGTTARNAMLDALESAIGTSPNLYIRSGAQPANCAAADAGSLGVTIALPSDWMAAASGGSKAKSGTWSNTASASITAGHWRIKDSGGSTCHMQGSITSTGGGGDMTLDNTSINTGQTVTINTFTLTAGNP